MDLINKYYRFLFGADIDRDGKWEKEMMMIPFTRTLRDVFSHLACIAILDGPHVKHVTTCQTFAIRFMFSFGMSNEQIFKHELRNTIHRLRPPLIIHINEKMLKYCRIRRIDTDY